MADQPAKLDKQVPVSASSRQDSSRNHFGAESIKAGLQWLSAAHEQDHWTDFSMFHGAGEVWLTACVLARLGELPEGYINHSLRQQIERSLDWLEHARIAGQGWSGDSSVAPDAFTTSWAIIALRSHRRSFPRSCLDLILRCRRANGGFSAFPQGSAGDGPYNVSSAEVTVTALRALSMCDSAAEAYLASQLRSDVPSGGAAKVARLYVCSEILEWEGGLGSWSFLNRISQSVALMGVETPYEQALLLRSLLRLRNQRAWTVASTLREMQLVDGSWPAVPGSGPLNQSGAPGTADIPTLNTVTAVSALVMSESQPGLYFGSDLPLPRRFRDC